MPLCSIIMPSYKAKPFIARSIQSIQQQTFKDWELIIIDDASQDGTAKYINDEFVTHDERIKLIELDTNSGAAVARNTGIKAATGRFIAFLDSDDVWMNTKLEKQLAFMQEQGHELTYTAYDKVDENGEALGYVGVPDKVSYKQLLKTNVIGCSTAIYDTSLVGKIYMPLIRKRQDFGLWLRILKKIDYAIGINEPMTVYTVRKGSVSSNKREASQYTWKIYREVEKLSLPLSLYYFAHYSVRGLLRTKFPKLARILGVLR